MKWEYLVKLPDNNFIDQNELDKLGDKGWELISVDNGIAYFKRPIEVILVESDEKIFAGGSFTRLEKRYSYDSVQDGYVIYDNRTKLSGLEVETLLNND